MQIPVLEGNPENTGNNNTDDTPQTGNVNVTVKDESGNPLQGVDVLVSDGITGDEYEGTTGSAGGCNINNVPVGTYELLGIKEGYEQYYGYITVVAGNNKAEFVMIEE